VFYYFSDHLKTASVITDSVGVIKAESDYYPWGGELQFVNNDSNDYKFTGKKRDSETGLDYYGARYYSNGLGRFISADWSSVPVPVPYADLSNPQSLNQYAYVRNNPMSYDDPDGHDCPACPPPTAPNPTAVEVDTALESVQRATAAAEEGAAGVSFSAILTGAALVFVPAHIFAPSVGQSDADERAVIEQASRERARQNGGVDPQAPTPNTPNTQPKPQTPPAPQAAAEHDKNKRRSTKDKHEKVRPGESRPPKFKPFREFEQPKDDKKKDREKPPYHRKDRDKKQEGS